MSARKADMELIAKQTKGEEETRERLMVEKEALVRHTQVLT